MSLALAGLSNSDIHHYYGGSVLMGTGGIFKVEECDKTRFRGFSVDAKNLWVPCTYTGEELTVQYPTEGYIQIKNTVHVLKQRVQRSRKKGMCTESYSLNTVGGVRHAVTPVNLFSPENLKEVFYTRNKLTYEQAQTLLKRKVTTAVALSRTLCIQKVNGARMVYLRGMELGGIKEKGLDLSKKHAVFQQELAEYGIPVNLIGGG